MGKRKSTAKLQGKAKVTLDKEFNCLFCNHEKSVSCKLDKANKIGTLICKSCGVTYQTNINYLSAPIDIFSDWVDACEDVAQQNEKQPTSRYVDEDDETQRMQQKRILEAEDDEVEEDDEDNIEEEEEEDEDEEGEEI